MITRSIRDNIAPFEIEAFQRHGRQACRGRLREDGLFLRRASAPSTVALS